MPPNTNESPDEFRSPAGLTVRPAGKSVFESAGETATRQVSSGNLHLFDVSQPPTLKVSVAYAVWDNGDRDVRSMPGPEPRELVDRLARGLRMSIFSVEGNLSWMELTLAEVSSKSELGQWATPKRPALEEIFMASRLDARDALFSSGAIGVGSRATLLGDDGRRRNVAAVTFPAENRLVPVVAYVVTRILPMYYAYRMYD